MPTSARMAPSAAPGSLTKPPTGSAGVASLVGHTSTPLGFPARFAGMSRSRTRSASDGFGSWSFPFSAAGSSSASPDRSGRGFSAPSLLLSSLLFLSMSWSSALPSLLFMRRRTCALSAAHSLESGTVISLPSSFASRTFSPSKSRSSARISNFPDSSRQVRIPPAPNAGATARTSMIWKPATSVRNHRPTIIRAIAPPSRRLRIHGGSAPHPTAAYVLRCGRARFRSPRLL